ncbi:MAG: hypothetical protein ACR2OH_02320, partial [Microthrixaceae bacterium]
EDFSPREMRRTPQFHLISLTFAVSAGAGLMAIGLMKLYPVESLTDSGLSEDQASAIAGNAMALFFSVANGAGRLVWGTISDRLGRKNSVIAMTASQGVFLLAFIPMAGHLWCGVPDRRPRRVTDFPTAPRRRGIKGGSPRLLPQRSPVRPLDTSPRWPPKGVTNGARHRSLQNAETDWHCPATAVGSASPAVGPWATISLCPAPH